MGNSSSTSARGHQDDTVDFGHLSPQGVYATGPRDWNQAIVAQLIVSRRLAPFYRPLEEFEESWDDEQILAARKELPDLDASQLEQTTTTQIEATAAPQQPPRTSHSKRPSTLKEPARPEATVYRGAVECPICFLYYPPNINHSRCCDQAICTECFVQIKRSEPTPTHLVSDPACCPYCVQENFGIHYNPPPWKAGIGSESPTFPWSDSRGSSGTTDRPPYPTHKRRQKSFDADSPEVVTIDQIRPDWEAKLAAVKAAVTRRANRRIIMRQVGDRLIPIGVTSGRVHALTPEEVAAAAAAAEAAEGSGSRRRRRQQQGSPGNAMEQYIGLAGQDLEEMMLMEAMRLSLLEHEEHQRKQAEEEKKKKATEQTASPTTAQPLGVPSASPPPSASSSNMSGHRSSSSLQAGRPSFFSRSRSPSPNPANAQSTPPAFSTLTAALSTTSTASALLASSSSNPSSPLAPSLPPPEQPSPAVDKSIPVITVATNFDASASASRQDSAASDATLDSLQAESERYQPLASSPESLSATEPLLLDKSDGANKTPTIHTSELPRSL